MRYPGNGRVLGLLVRPRNTQICRNWSSGGQAVTFCESLWTCVWGRLLISCVFWFPQPKVGQSSLSQLLNKTSSVILPRQKQTNNWKTVQIPYREPTFWYVVPVRRQIFELSSLDGVKQFVLVPLDASERRESTQQDIGNHSCRPVINFKPVTWKISWLSKFLKI